MNSLNINNFEKFPVTRETFSFLQDMINMVAQLVALGASSGNYILSGCVVNGMAVSAGFVVINGELLPFQAGTVTTTVTIQETRTTVTANGESYTDIRISRVAKFQSGIGDNFYSWTDFKRVKTLAELMTMFPAVFVQPVEPAGTKDGDFWVTQ